MKNSIQLQQGLSLSEFKEKYGEETLCRQLLNRRSGLMGSSARSAPARVTACFGTVVSKHFSVTAVIAK